MGGNPPEGALAERVPVFLLRLDLLIMFLCLCGGAG
jgi:hypothetical protein